MRVDLPRRLDGGGRDGLRPIEEIRVRDPARMHELHEDMPALACTACATWRQPSTCAAL